MAEAFLSSSVCEQKRSEALLLHTWSSLNSALYGFCCESDVICWGSRGGRSLIWRTTRTRHLSRFSGPGPSGIMLKTAHLRVPAEPLFARNALAGAKKTPGMSVSAVLCSRTDRSVKFPSIRGFYSRDKGIWVPVHLPL